MKKNIVLALIIPALISLPGCLNSKCRVKKSCSVNQYTVSQSHQASNGQASAA